MELVPPFEPLPEEVVAWEEEHSSAMQALVDDVIVKTEKLMCLEQSGDRGY